MKKLFLTLITAISCLALNAETWTVGGVSYTVSRNSTSYLGTSYHTRLEKISLTGSNGDKLRLFTTYTDLTNYDVNVRTGQGGSKLSSKAKVATIAGTFTDEKAIAGVNADFFSTYPAGMVVNQGTIHKGFSGDGYSAICIDQNKVPYIGLLSSHTCWLYNVSTSTELGYCSYAAVNTTSSTASNAGVGEQIIFYTPQYGTSSDTGSTGGYAVQLTPVNGNKLTPGTYSEWTVASAPSTASVTIPSGGIVMYGKGSLGTAVSGLKVGNKIRVYLRMYLKEVDGTIGMSAESPSSSTGIHVQNAVGGSQMILCNGTTISSYANTDGAISSDQPRTAVGYTANKKGLIMCVVDGRNSGYSNGCTGKMMGDIMKALGCSDALNFDGGGSSQFWVTGSGLINDANTNNSGGGIRSVADALFITEIPGATLSASASSLSFATENNATAAKSVTATVTNWRTNVSLSLSGTNADQFALSSTSIAKSATGSGSVTVTYKPTKAGTHTATLTLTTNQYTNKEISKTITLTGTNTVVVATPALNASASELSFSTTNNASTSKNLTVSGTNLAGDIALALSGTDASAFKLSAASIAKATATGNITVTYAPESEGSHSAVLTISSTNASNVTVNLSGSNTVTPAEDEEATEPTLTTVWENTSANLPANGRYATAFGGKIYISDYNNKKIVEVSGANDNNVTDYMTNDAFLGSAITSDQAGNIIISNSGTGNNSTFNNWAIIPAGSKSEVKTIAVPTPSSVTAGRVDLAGRVIGDVASAEGAYMYLIPAPSDASSSPINKYVVCVKIANNQVTAVNTSSEFKWAFGSSNIAQPMLTTVSSISGTTNPADYAYVKNRYSDAIYYIKDNAPAYYTITKDDVNVSGFDVFELGGVKYVVYPTTNLSFNIAKLNDNTVVASESDSTPKNNTFNTFVAEVVSETKVNIYQYHVGTKAAMYTFEIPAGDTTAIEEVEAEEEAPVEYYNIQGVRVVNPEKGLYIKRQGNKVTKVIL